MATLSICPKCDSLNKVNPQEALNKTPTCGKCKTALPMHGLVSEVSGQGLKRILAKANQPVIVDFWASWCGPCKAYAPIFERASKSNSNAIFLKINTEESPQVSSELGIRGIPTTIVFKNGKEALRQSGSLPEEMISKMLRS